MKNLLKGIFLTSIILLLTCCKDTTCRQADERYPISGLYKDWPFIAKYEYQFGTFDTTSIDSSGKLKKIYRGISKNGEYNAESCPHLYGEKIGIDYYHKPGPNISPLFIFKTLSYSGDNPSGSLEINYLPVDSNILHYVNALYTLKDLDFVKYIDWQPGISSTGLNSPKNALKLDSIQSFNKTYYNVWKFTIHLNDSPLCYKTLYFDPKFGLIKEELNNGTIIDIQY